MSTEAISSATTVKLNDKCISSLLRFNKIPEEFSSSFALLGWKNLMGAKTSQAFDVASSKLNVKRNDIVDIVEAISNLFVESCRQKINSSLLCQDLVTLGLSQEKGEALTQIYGSNQDTISQILLQESIEIPAYNNLEWRLETTLGTRSLTEQIEPNVLMKLSLSHHHEPGGGILLKTDPGNLIHITQALEGALEELQGQHSKRVERRFKSKKNP